jgi:hypothetical protein
MFAVCAMLDFHLSLDRIVQSKDKPPVANRKAGRVVLKAVGGVWTFPFYPNLT